MKNSYTKDELIKAIRCPQCRKHDVEIRQDGIKCKRCGLFLWKDIRGKDG